MKKKYKKTRFRKKPKSKNSTIHETLKKIEMKKKGKRLKLERNKKDKISTRETLMK